MLRFPDLTTLRFALTSGAVPPEVALAPASAAFEGEAVRVRASAPVPKAGLSALRKLGVREAGGKVDPAATVEVGCWPQLLPLERDPARPEPGPSTPVVFELPAAGVPALVGEVLRLGNDRQGVRWLVSGEGDEARALVRVVGPPFYSLLRAVDRDEGDASPRAFLERAPGVFVELGWTHPLLGMLRPPAGRWAMLRAPRDWAWVEAEAFRDVYQLVDFRLDAPPARWREAEPPGRLTAPLRLVRGGASEGAELWVLTERAWEQVEDLVRAADDRLTSRLAFAVGEADGRSTVVIRLRPSKQPPPVVVLEGEGYRAHLRLPNLFVPVGARLNPPLRRDVVAGLLAPDPARVTWLSPHSDGTFTPESLPDEAFRPLDQWVDYVLDREHRALQAWVESARFEFEPFVCDEEGEAPADPTPRRRRAKEEAVAPLPPRSPKAAPTRQAKAREPKASLPLPAFQPDEAVVRLSELEAEFLRLDAPPDAEERAPLWRAMAGLNANLARMADAAVCWSHAVWEAAEPPEGWVDEWAEAEASATRRVLDGPEALDAWLAEPKPTTADLRALATALLRAALAGPAPGWLASRLGRVQLALEQHEARLPVRVAWLGWTGLARLSGGDHLALARARDRALERLHREGLSRDLDLPGFLRFAGGESGDRLRTVRDHLIAIRDAARAWVNVGNLVGPLTPALGDLVFAYGFARLGEADQAQQTLADGLGAIRRRDPVGGWLGRAFEARARQALEGKAAGPLPDDVLAELDAVWKPGDGDRSPAKADRYKIDRLRQHSRILEPNESIDPYRHWRGSMVDDLAREVAAVVDLTDREALAARLGALLAKKFTGAKAAAHEALVLRTAAEVAFRLGEAFARPLFDRVVPAIDKLDAPRAQAELLERAIRLAAHFDQPAYVRAYVARFDALMKALGAGSPALEPVLGQCFRGLRKLGMRDEFGQLLARVAERLAHLAADAAAGAGRDAPGRAQALRLLLHVAAGWLGLGQGDRAAPILDEARALLLDGDLLPVEQTALACGYVRALGQAPVATAIPRIGELFGRGVKVSDTFTTSSHYSLSRLDLIEAVVLTLVSEEFTLGESGRLWLEDDEYLVRRRIHRDVRAALGAEG